MAKAFISENTALALQIALLSMKKGFLTGKANLLVINAINTQAAMDIATIVYGSTDEGVVCSQLITPRTDSMAHNVFELKASTSIVILPNMRDLVTEKSAMDMLRVMTGRGSGRVITKYNAKGKGPKPTMTFDKKVVAVENLDAQSFKPKKETDTPIVPSLITMVVQQTDYVVDATAMTKADIVEYGMAYFTGDDDGRLYVKNMTKEHINEVLKLVADNANRMIDASITGMCRLFDLRTENDDAMFAHLSSQCFDGKTPVPIDVWTYETDEERQAQEETV